MENRLGYNDDIKSSQKHLVGLGLDHEDGHRRFTKGEDFSVLGGSEETHEKLTETLVKTFEDLGKKGKTLQNVETKELYEIIMKNSEAS